MFGSFLPSLWWSINLSLLGSRSRHCYAIKWFLGDFTRPICAFTRLVQLLEGSTFDDFADNFTGKGFIFGPYINFLGTGFIGIAAAMNTVRVKGEFNA